MNRFENILSLVNGIQSVICHFCKSDLIEYKKILVDKETLFCYCDSLCVNSFIVKINRAVIAKYMTVNEYKLRLTNDS